MIQPPSDKSLIDEARSLIASCEGNNDLKAARLLVMLSALTEALERHQTASPDAGWKDAWAQFDGKRST